jgi:hypothetical protein
MQPHRIRAALKAQYHVALATNPIDIIRRGARHGIEKQGLSMQLNVDRHCDTVGFGSLLQAHAERPGGGSIKAICP